MKATIRLAEKRDVPGILEIYAPFILDTAVTFEETVPDEESFWKRIQEIMEDLPFLVCEIDDRIAGYAYSVLSCTGPEIAMFSKRRNPRAEVRQCMSSSWT